MGAESFVCASWGKTAEEAFKKAVEQAQYDHGHSGYTGTIAEKSSFVMIELPKHKDPFDYADDLINSDHDERVSDKWGDAGCFEIPEDLYEEVAKKAYLDFSVGEKSEGNKLFLFFGIASS